jgi:hypothetical protein
MLNGTVPTYPDRISGSDYPITTGDTDGLFTTDVITQLTSQLRLGGYPDVTIGTAFTSTVGSAIVDWKSDIGYGTSTRTSAAPRSGPSSSSRAPATPTSPRAGSSRSHGTSWSPSTSTPHPATSRATRPSYDLKTSCAWKRTISYGENISKKRARVNARRIVNSGARVTIGTITLSSDPVDETPAGRSRFDIREGGWIQLNNFPGGYRPVLHRGRDPLPGGVHHQAHGVVPRLRPP